MRDYPDFSDVEQGWRMLAFQICGFKNRLIGVETDTNDLEFCLTGRLDDVVQDAVLSFEQVKAVTTQRMLGPHNPSNN